MEENFFNKSVQNQRQIQYEKLAAHAQTLHYVPVYSHETAAILWGFNLKVEEPPYHVTFASMQTRKRKTSTTIPHSWSGQLQVHQARNFRVVDPAVCWAQMATRVNFDTLIAMGAWFTCRDQSRRVMTLDDVQRYVAENHRFKGRQICLEALPLLIANTDSPPEAEFIVMLLRAGITGVVANLAVDLDGKRYYLDAAIESLRIAFEYQGAYHAETKQMRRDAGKHNVLIRNGWQVLYVTADNLRTQVARDDLVDTVKKVITHQQHLIGLAP